jgi:pyruvate dehydrogenase E1 component alpha subunit
MDVEAVIEASRIAVSNARRGEGPTLLECKAYRFHGHFTAEKALALSYRKQVEIDEWRLLDPLLSWTRKLSEAAIFDAGEQGAIDQQVELLLDEAVSYARSSPWPEPAEALDHMYQTPYPGLPARGSLWHAR